MRILKTRRLNVDNAALDKLYNYEFWHYRQGIGAYIVGQELDENPHQLGTREHAEWRSGFCSQAGDPDDEEF